MLVDLCISASFLGCYGTSYWQATNVTCFETAISLSIDSTKCHICCHLHVSSRMGVSLRYNPMISDYCSGYRTDYAARCRTLNHSPSTYGLGHIEAFFSWLDYCEQIVGSAQAPLGKAVCESIHEIFLSASLLPKLLKA